MKEYKTGANRNNTEGKLDFDGFMCPLVMQRFGEYMDKNRHLETGELRESDNWQKGIDLADYMKSGFRHFHDWWMEHRDYESRKGIEEALCGLIFNANGYLHEVLKAKKKKNGRK